MPKRDVSQLRIHPFNVEIYGEPDPGGITESLEQFGLEYPIEVDNKGQILSGARRWSAAKKLGWKDIDVRVLDPKSDEEARKHILLANAYRSVKTVYTRQKETDAYRHLLARGEVTKEELASLARQHGKAPVGPDDFRPQRLAAAAAGISDSTYKSAAYVTDPRRGESAIDSAAREGLIAKGQASALKRELKRTQVELKRDRVGAETAANVARQRLREAQLQHGYTEQELSERRANEAGVNAVRKGKAFVNAIEQLRHGQYAKHLGPRIAFILAGTVYEAKQALEGLAKKGRIQLPTKTDDLKQYADADEADYEVVG